MSGFQKKLSRKVWEEAPYKFERRPLPINTLTNADGTPYSAGYDEKSLGQIAYERLTGHPYFKRELKALFGVFAPGNSVPWMSLPTQEQRVWEEVAEAVIRENMEIRT